MRYIRRTFDNSAEIQEKFKDHPLMLTVCNKKFVQKQLKYIHEDEIRVESMFAEKLGERLEHRVEEHGIRTLEGTVRLTSMSVQQFNRNVREEFLTALAK